jgi:hypothetical protein
MSSRSRAQCLCLLLLLPLATPAVAQTRHGFVEAGILADYDPTLRTGQNTSAGVTGSAGVFITPRWSLRLEINYPQWHGTQRSGENRVGDHIEAFDLKEEGRAPSRSLLVGRDLGQASRVRFSWVAGLTTTQRQSRTSGWTERRDLQGHVTTHTEINRRSPDYRWWAATVGADVTIALTGQLALIPQIRVHTYGGLSEHTSELFVRPRVTLRWQF